MTVYNLNTDQILIIFKKNFIKARVILAKAYKIRNSTDI